MTLPFATHGALSARTLTHGYYLAQLRIAERPLVAPKQRRARPSGRWSKAIGVFSENDTSADSADCAARYSGGFTRTRCERAAPCWSSAAFPPSPVSNAPPRLSHGTPNASAQASDLSGAPNGRRHPKRYSPPMRDRSNAMIDSALDGGVIMNWQWQWGSCCLVVDVGGW